MCQGSCAGYNGCNATGGGNSGSFDFGSNGGGSNVEKTPLYTLALGSSRGGSGFHGNGDGDGDGDGSSGDGDGGSDGGGNANVKKAPPNPLVSETVHDKRADDDGGPASEVEQQDNSTPFPTPSFVYWASEPPTALEERCTDRDGEFLTHLSTFQQCRWLNYYNVDDKRERNCGATEIRLSCLEPCPSGNKTTQVTVETGGAVEPGVGLGVAALNDAVDDAAAAESKLPAAHKGTAFVD